MRRLALQNRGARRAVAMIELIFSLVIIGIAIVSAPNLMAVATKSSTVVMQQEAINIASSHINMVLSYAWDEEDSSEEHTPTLLKVSNGHADLENSGNGRRAGTPEGSSRVFTLDDGSILYASSIGTDAGESSKDDFDDIDDFDGDSAEFTVVESATTDVIDANITIATEVTYAKDDVSGGYQQSEIEFVPFRNESTGTTNIKDVKVTLTTNATAKELEKSIVLRAFACNIGGIKIVQKEF